MLIPSLLTLAGVGTIVALAITNFDKAVPEHDPDIAQPPPGSTGYRLVDAILPDLQKAAISSGIPLGLLVGWIAKESGGKLGETTKYDERGYFQLMPAESKSIGVDHQRLSTDSNYSINAGLLLIAYYMKAVDKLGVAQPGSSYYWRLVKLAHSMGSGAMDKIVAAAKAAGQAGSWQALEGYAINNATQLLSATKHNPDKWFPFVDQVAEVGEPFGFGTGGTAVVGGASAFDDIVDPLDCISAA